MDDRQQGYIEKILFKILIKYLGFTAGYLSGQKECNSCELKILLRSIAPELFDVVRGVLVGVSSLAISILKLPAAAAAAALSLSSSSCSQ
jgi:hypothetical protein